MAYLFMGNNGADRVKISNDMQFDSQLYRIDIDFFNDQVPVHKHGAVGPDFMRMADIVLALKQKYGELRFNSARIMYAVYSAHNKAPNVRIMNMKHLTNLAFCLISQFKGTDFEDDCKTLALMQIRSAARARATDVVIFSLGEIYNSNATQLTIKREVTVVYMNTFYTFSFSENKKREIYDTFIAPIFKIQLNNYCNVFDYIEDVANIAPLVQWDFEEFKKAFVDNNMHDKYPEISKAVIAYNDAE